MVREVVLVSSSPRRSELLRRIVPFFKVVKPNFDDESHSSSPIDNAIKKLGSVERREGTIYISADTAVIVDGMILGKPNDREDARRMLNLLSGRWHIVETAVVVSLNDLTLKEVVRSEVRFRELMEDEIEFYLDTDEPYDKAGAYGIQGFAEVFVSELRGSYSNVVGLPLEATYRLLRKVGYRPFRYTTLGEFADIVRSKNAGPFMLTFDIMFSDWDRYVYFKEGNFVSVESFCEYMGIPLEDVIVFEYYDSAQALKITVKRNPPSGSIYDDDIYGATSYVKLLKYPIPLV